MSEAQVKEWARNGSFMKKPSTGWLHDDASLSNGDGVYYPVKVCGVEQSEGTSHDDHDVLDLLS